MQNNAFEDWKVELLEELSSSYLIDKDTFYGHESMFERTTALGKRVENVLVGTHLSSLMTFYPDMWMTLSCWSDKNVFQDLVKQGTWFPEVKSSEIIGCLVGFRKKPIKHASPSQLAEILNMLLTDLCSIFLTLLLADKLPCTVLIGIMLWVSCLLFPLV